MRRVLLAGTAVAIAAVAMAGSADAAWGWRGGFWGPHFYRGPSFSFGIYAPLYARPPVYYAPPPVYYAPPPVVVQQGYVAPPPVTAAPAEPNPGFWYYCNNPQGYYPYVQQCGTQWMTVPANPNGAAQ